MRIGIIGSGALGCLFASALCKQAEVVQLGHWPAQMQALANDGLRIVDGNGRIDHVHYATATSPQQSDKVDLAIILVKSWQTASALKKALQLLKPDGFLLTLQNGMGNYEQLINAVGTARAMLGVTSQGATVLEPGLVRHAGSGMTYLGSNSSTMPIATRLQEMLTAVHFPTQISDDVAGLSWGKLIINCSINPLTALLQKPNGHLLSEPQLHDLMGQIAQETALVAKAAGVQLPFDDPVEQATAVALATAANYSSMLQDVLRGAPTEIEAICGQVVQYGRQHRVPTPLNGRLHTLIKNRTNKPMQINELMAALTQKESQATFK